jgi:hypothetical protein
LTTDIFWNSSTLICCLAASTADQHERRQFAKTTGGWRNWIIPFGEWLPRWCPDLRSTSFLLQRDHENPRKNPTWLLLVPSVWLVNLNIN